jgi:hypothetical protein
MDPHSLALVFAYSVILVCLAMCVLICLKMVFMEEFFARLGGGSCALSAGASNQHP